MKIFGMRFFDKAKDGGPESNVTGYWLVEIKGLFSIAMLRFSDGTRDAYHSHAFDSLNWVLRGKVREEHVPEQIEIAGHLFEAQATLEYRPSWRPILTRRSTFHRVRSIGTTWVFTLRGPWSKTWHENVNGERITLTHGRVRVA